MSNDQERGRRRLHLGLAGGAKDGLGDGLERLNDKIIFVDDIQLDGESSHR